MRADTLRKAALSTEHVPTLVENPCRKPNAFQAWWRSHVWTTKTDLEEMEYRIAIKVSEIKAAVSALKQQNREAFAEIGTKIADLNKQIADLIAGVGDPAVTDEAFEQDLRDLQADAKALADIVPGSPTPPVEPPAPPAEPA